VTFAVLGRESSGYYLLEPDIAHPVAPLVHVANSKPAKGGGALYFVDVQEEQPTKLHDLWGWLFSDPPHSTRIPSADIIPPGSNSQQVITTERREMATSQQTAAAVALRALGYHVGIDPNGVMVNQLFFGTAAARLLQANDVITAVNGHATRTIAALHVYMATVHPGDTVRLTVVRGNVVHTIKLKTVNEAGRALIGIAPEQSAKITLPFKVSIDAGDIGGPSAGLAFTLEVMRQLGRDVTHGYRIAATGQINIDGTVSPIGGVEQKTWGVRERGAQIFLVPAGGNAKTAEKNAGPNLKIIPVTSLDQALKALAALPKLK
jgi:PDZ domain-containing protein